MKKILLLLLFITTSSIFSQDIVGKWKTVDDKRNVTTSIFEIYKDGDTYYGKILEILVKENVDACVSCEGKYHNKKLQNLVILSGLKKEDNTYEDGKIIDPESGKTYSCYLELVKPNKLKVRGYLGFSLIGRTQYWYRVSE